MEKFDFVVVGAGPAGATAARLLAHSFKILIVDSRNPLDMDDRREKCCGGLLAPDAQKALASLDLALPENVIGGPQIFAVDTIDLESGAERIYQRFYLNLSRRALDSWLLEMAIKDGAVFRSNLRFSAFDGAVVTLSGGNTTQYVNCRRLIAADGAAGAVRRKLGTPVRKNSIYVAIQEKLAPAGNEKFFRAFFDADSTDYYGWSIPKRDHLLFGGIFPSDGTAIMRFMQMKSKAVDFGVQVDGALLHRAGSLVVRPRGGGDLWLGRGQVFAVGEAAGLISPSSAEGVSYALRSSMLLAGMLTRNPDADVREYSKLAWKLKINLIGKRLKSPFMYSPFLRKAVLKSGVGAI